MIFMVIFGPSAVGKMTVGHHVQNMTGLHLFHNHMTIDLVRNFFDYTQPQFRRLVDGIRLKIFREVAKSDLRGIIFTYVWVLNLKIDTVFMQKTIDIFKKENASIYFVELEADIDVRLQRNKTEFRLSQKPSKLKDDAQGTLIKTWDETYKLNSSNDFEYKNEKYIKINNTHLSPNETAQLITKKFDLANETCKNDDIF